MFPRRSQNSILRCVYLSICLYINLRVCVCWFSDEPTTGMDPKIRRNIWNMIIKKKTNRVIIMTTHSMEEADILGDSIAILANGHLRLDWCVCV